LPGTSQVYVGGWNASTNTPTMTSGALVNGVLSPVGNYYIVTVGGTTAAIDGTTVWNAGDYITSNGTVWTRVQASGSAYLPLTGGTVSGATTFSAASNPLTIGASGQSTFSFAPGASTANTAFINSNGSIGFGPGNAAGFGVNLGSGLSSFGTIATAAYATGGNANDGATGNTFTVNNILRSNFYRTTGATYNGSGSTNGVSILSFTNNWTGGFGSNNNMLNLNIPTDQVTSQPPAPIRVTHNFGGGSAVGGRGGSTFQMNQVGAVAGPAGAQNVVANFWFTTSYGFGGTGPGAAAAGYAYCLNPQMALQPGAGYWALANALGEIDIRVVGTSQTMTIAGTATAGDVISITFANAAITGSPVTVTYTVGTAQTVPAIANGVLAAIWANSALTYAGVSATIANGTGQITLCWPLEMGTVTVTRAVSGAATETVTFGSVVAGASADVKNGMTIVREGADTGPPMTDSAAIAVGDQPTSPAAAWRNGIQFGGRSSQWPIAPRGTIIQATSSNVVNGVSKSQPMVPALATLGIDFSKVNFTQQSGNALAMPGFRLDGAGNAYHGVARVGMGSSGLVIDSVGWTGSGNASVVAGGGSGGTGLSVNAYFVGDVIYDDLGGQHIVTGVNPANGAVTALTTVVQPSGPAGSAPAGTRNTTGGSGVNLTVGITWVAATTLSLNPSGGPVTVTGGLQAIGGFTSGNNGAAGTAIILNGLAANLRRIEVMTSGSLRWRFGGSSDAESGGGLGSSFFINGYNDSGALVGSAMTINRSTLQTAMPRIRLGQTFNYTGQTPSNDFAGFNMSSNYTGSTDGSGWVNLNGYAINTDTLDAGASQQAIGFNIAHNIGGTGITGGRTLFRGQLTSNGAFPANGNYQGIVSSVTMQHSSGGTDLYGGASGVAFGGAVYGSLASGATNWRGVVGLEIDYAVGTGATAGGVNGLQVSRFSSHAYSPTIWEADTCICIGSAAPANQAKLGFSVGQGNGNWPIDNTNGRMIGSAFTNNWWNTVPMQARQGLDWYNVDCTNTALRIRGFSVLGSGRALPAGTVQVGGAYLSSPSGGAVALDVVGSVCTAAAIATGGINLSVGTALVHDDTGTLAFVSTVSGGVATAVTLVANTGSALTPPTNPVTFRVSTHAALTLPGVPTAPTLNLTWTAASGLSLNPTGARIGFNGTAPITRPTVSGAKGGNAALGSLLSALAAYGLVTDSTSA